VVLLSGRHKTCSSIFWDVKLYSPTEVNDDVSEERNAVYSESKSKPNKKVPRSSRPVQLLLLAGFFLDLLSDPEDGSNTFLRKVGGFLPDVTAYNSRKLFQQFLHCCARTLLSDGDCCVLSNSVYEWWGLLNNELEVRSVTKALP
jgi:hypothetical protein